MDLLREKLRAQGHHCPGVAAAMIGSAVVGGAISASSANSAANKQSAAANRATDAQTAMFNKTVALNDPYNQAGQGAMGVLGNLLGTSTGPAPGALTGASLVDTSSGVPSYNKQLYNSNEAYRNAWDDVYNIHLKGMGKGYTSQADPQWIDQQVRQRLAPQYAEEAAAPKTVDPSFGSLLKPFGMDDFQLDPGIQFQTQQGNQALMNSQAAKNGTLSGGALKDLIAYNQGMAGTGYQSAFDRYMANKSFTLGSLMDMTKVGQAAASGTASGAPSFSSGIAGSIMGAGNAQAAGTVGMGNALSGAASSAGNSYFLSSLLSKSGSASGTPAGGVVSDDSIANFA